MFGTIAHMRPKQGKEQAVIAMHDEWMQVRRPKVDGHVGGYIIKSEKNLGELMLVAIFRDRDSYFKNANDPEQDRWYQRLRALLDADPTWEDGEIMSSTPGQMRQTGR